MAKVNTFTGSTGSNYWTWKIIVTEGTGSIATMKVPVTIALYLGRTSQAGGSYFGGSCTLNYTCGSQNYSTSFSTSYQTVSAGGWYKMGEYTFQVDSGATVNVTGAMASASFSPTWGSASGTITVETLHIAPEFTSVTLTELDSRLTSLSVPNDTIVNLLSNKRIAITTQLYDSATITNYKSYDANNNQIGTGASSPITANFQNNSVDSGLLKLTATDSLSGIGTYQNTYTFIPYAKPNLENASTTIKRKTTSSVGLIDNKVNLNLQGTIYKGNDLVGNANTVVCKYKIWKENTTEPAYTTSKTQSLAGDGTLIYETNSATVTLNNGVISITNLEISLVNYLNVYNYKIYVEDYYGNNYSVANTIPTGDPVWTEYKDRVNFKKITQKSYPVPYYVDLFSGTPTQTPTLNDNVSNYDMLLVMVSQSAGEENEVYNVLKYNNSFNGKWRLTATDTYYANVGFTATGTSATLNVIEIRGWTSSAIKIYRIIGIKI